MTDGHKTLSDIGRIDLENTPGPGDNLNRRITKAQKRAIAWLKERNGTGILDRYGRLVAVGEVATFHPTTWLRLVAAGILWGDGGRLNLNLLDDHVRADHGIFEG